jgi:hypothetical protein
MLKTSVELRHKIINPMCRGFGARHAELDLALASAKLSGEEALPHKRWRARWQSQQI